MLGDGLQTLFSYFFPARYGSIIVYRRSLPYFCLLFWRSRIERNSRKREFVPRENFASHASI